LYSKFSFLGRFLSAINGVYDVDGLQIFKRGREVVDREVLFGWRCSPNERYGNDRWQRSPIHSFTIKSWEGTIQVRLSLLRCEVAPQRAGQHYNMLLFWC
jgi:hypothetical protein